MSSDLPAPGQSPGMSPLERRATLSLAGIFMLRMLGLFMIFPVLSLHADEYPDATPLFIGLAISVYGLTQALFQIPFGILSDRIGRKPVISAGLVVFAIGSAVAALSDTMGGVIAGRALQGLGAIAAAVMALTADLTREEHRTKAMAIIGVSIGFAFVLAQVLGPAVARWLGLSALFWMTGALALGGLAVLHLYVPNPVRTAFHRDAEPVLAQFGRILSDRELLRLDAGVLVLHLVMTANTVVVPLALRDRAGVAEEHFWIVYAGVLAMSVLLMAPAIVVGERRAQLKPVLIGSVVALALSQAGLIGMNASLWPLIAMLVLYFFAFNVLEATLPSLVSRLSPGDLKGTSLAAFSTSQYFGAFLGGPLGGWLYGAYGIEWVFVACGAACVAWIGFASPMRNPAPVATHLVKLRPFSESDLDELTARLLAVPGVSEAIVIREEGVAYLKVDRRRLDHEALRAFSMTGA